MLFVIYTFENTISNLTSSWRKIDLIFNILKLLNFFMLTETLI